MSDTLHFLASQGSEEADTIDLAALADALPEMTRAELDDAVDGLGLLPFAEEAIESDIRATLADHIAAENGTLGAADVTHVLREVGEAAPPAPMVSETASVIDTDTDTHCGSCGQVLPQDLSDAKPIVKVTPIYWQNPYTGNKVVNDCADTDGRQNVNGYAVWVAAENPADTVYDDE